MNTPPSKALKKLLIEEWHYFLLDIVQLVGFLLIMKLAEVLVKLLFHGAMLFGVFPKEWLFDAGDIGSIGCFAYRNCLRLLRSRI